MAALPPRRLMNVMASGEMTMSIEWQAPRSGHWMRTPGIEMRPPAGGCRMSVEADYRSAPC